MAVPWRLERFCSPAANPPALTRRDRPGRDRFNRNGCAPMSAANAAALYARISEDAGLKQSLFRQALQDPTGALRRIVEIGEEWGLAVTSDEVREHLAGLEDGATKQWLLKARGGL